MNDNDAYRNITLVASDINDGITRNDSIYDLVLATVTVTGNASEVKGSDITDTRLDSTRCGAVTTAIKSVQSLDLFTQVTELFKEIKAQNESEMNANRTEFNDWFETVKDTLDENTAGKLSNRISDVENMIMENHFTTILLTEDGTLVDENSHEVLADWKYKVDGNQELNGYIDNIGNSDNISYELEQVKAETSKLKEDLSHINKLLGAPKYIGYGLSSEDGSISEAPEFTTSEFIDVIPCASYILEITRSVNYTYEYPRIALYTKNKTFIKRLDIIHSLDSVRNLYKITVTNNCRYIRFMDTKEVYESSKLYIYNEIMSAEYNTTNDLKDLEDLKYNAILKKTIYSNGNFVFGHINASGEIRYNDYKNICFEKPILALRGSTVSVDIGYKYQIGLYDSNMKFKKRITWQTEPYTLDEDSYVILEISDIEESTLYDTSIEQYIHYKLIASIPIEYDELKKMFDTEIKFINGGNITLAYDIGTVVDLTPQNIPSYRYAIIECEYNDEFLLNVQGGINPRAWGFVDVNNVLLSVAGANTSADNILVHAPINSAKLIINDNNTSKECFKLGRVSQNTHEIRLVSNDISIINAENNKNFLYQFDNIITAFGYDFAKAIGKVFTVTGENGYNSWPFLGNANGVLVCLYSKGIHHVDNASNLYYKTSNNGIIWSAGKKLMNNYGIRTNVTGKGNDSNGNLLFWVRSGSVGGDSNTFSLFRTLNGNTFEKVSSPIFTIKAGHIGDIAFVESMGLVAFYNTYHGSINSYGYVLSEDNGITWEQHEIGRTDSFNDLPTEISFVNLGEGKILAMGRSEISSPMYQIESSDNGNTWNTSVTNISDVGLSTPNLILDNEYISVYYYDRRNGKLKFRKSKATDVFGNPTNWGESSVLAIGTTGQDAGNVNATIFNNHHVVSYYSGNENAAKVYTVID